MAGETAIVDLDTDKVVQRRQLQPNTGKVLFGAEEESIIIEQMMEQALETVAWNWSTDTFRTLCSGGPSSLSDDGGWLVTERAPEN